ncbi:MAG: hypothetical protein QW434_01670 [Pyrobaculum sp.]
MVLEVLGGGDKVVASLLRAGDIPLAEDSQYTQQRAHPRGEEMAGGEIPGLGGEFWTVLGSLRQKLHRGEAAVAQDSAFVM